MNAIAKTIPVTQGLFPLSRFELTISLTKIKIIMFVVLLLSALGLIYVKDLNRRLFIAYQEQQQIASVLNSDYSKLLLEKSAWATQARIIEIANQKLNMIFPPAKNVTLVRLNTHAA